MPADNN